MSLHSSDNSRIIPGSYTPSTMPPVGSSLGMYAWDTTYGCYMICNGTVWMKPSFDVWTDFYGNTNSSGDYAVTYTTPKAKVPFVGISLDPGLDSSLLFRLASSTVNGFSIKCEARAMLTVLGINLLSFAVTNVNNQ